MELLLNLVICRAFTFDGIKISLSLCYQVISIIQLTNSLPYSTLLGWAGWALLYCCFVTLRYFGSLIKCFQFCLGVFAESSLYYTIRVCFQDTIIKFFHGHFAYGGLL